VRRRRRDHGERRGGGVRGGHRPGHHQHQVHHLRPPRQARRLAPARVQAALPGGRVSGTALLFFGSFDVLRILFTSRIVMWFVLRFPGGRQFTTTC
jgi:hypothetical protein